MPLWILSSSSSARSPVLLLIMSKHCFLSVLVRLYPICCGTSQKWKKSHMLNVLALPPAHPNITHAPAPAMYCVACHFTKQLSQTWRFHQKLKGQGTGTAELNFCPSPFFRWKIQHFGQMGNPCTYISTIPCQNTSRTINVHVWM